MTEKRPNHLFVALACICLAATFGLLALLGKSLMIGGLSATLSIGIYLLLVKTRFFNELESLIIAPVLTILLGMLLPVISAIL